MHSWGPDVDDAAQRDLDRVLDAGLRLAQAHLAEAAHFEPELVVVADDGRVLGLAADRAGLGKHPEVDEVLASAVRQLRRVRSEVVATALVINTRLHKERTDAIEVRLEHRDGAAATILLPYKRATFGARVDYGTLTGFVARRLVWA